MKRALAPVAAAAALVAAAPAGAIPYTGTIVFRGAEPSRVALELGASSSVVALAPAHAAHTVVAVSRRGGRIGFAVPGRPGPLRFVLRRRGRNLVGSARQGAASATVRLHPGRSADESLGLFADGSGPYEVLRTTRFGFTTAPLGLDLTSGAFEHPTRHGTRLAVDQFEVRFRSGRTMLAGTLTLPPGAGPFPAAVYVSGSGATLREEAQYIGGLLVADGVALLAYDKRGVGESGGRFPGELATSSAIATYAGDALAAVRFLAAQPEIDRTKIGLAGLSQGGWIIPQAAVRSAGLVSWMFVQGGPTVTQGESDYYASIAEGWTGPLSAAEAQARASGPSGYDPMPWLARLPIPGLWDYGGDDRAEPPDTSISLLQKLRHDAGRDYTIHLYPGAPHPLVTAAGFAPGIFADVRAWLAVHGI